MREGAAVSAIRLAAPALLMSVLFLAPFFDKAFTIDDVLFLREAQQIIVNPMRPGAYDVVWDQDVPIRAAAGSLITGPVTGYLLVASALAGGSEPVAHLVMVLLLCGAAVATASIALHLRYEPWKALAAAALLVSTPAVIAMGSTSMPDLPAMAFGVMAVERYVAWTKERRLWQGVAATLLLALAVLTRSHMMWLLGVMGLPPLINLYSSRTAGSGFRPIALWWLPLAAALVIVSVLQWVTRDHSPETLRSQAMLLPLFSWGRIPSNLLAFGVHWVLAFPLGLAWFLLRWRALCWPLAAGVVTAWLVPIPQSAPRWTAPVAVLGFLAILDVLCFAWRRRDWAKLSLGVWLLMGVLTVPYIHHPAKYEVPAAPAAALLIAGQLPPARRRWVPAALIACIGGSLLGVAIVRADAVLAGLARQAAAELIRPLVGSGKRVWFAGHWGYQWYAERAGARPLTLDGPYPEPGDLVVSSAVDECPALLHFPRRTLLQQRIYSSEGGRVMSKQDQAGFYSNLWGYLPWSWGAGDINRFEVWRIE